MFSQQKRRRRRNHAQIFKMCVFFIKIMCELCSSALYGHRRTKGFRLVMLLQQPGKIKFNCVHRATIVLLF